MIAKFHDAMLPYGGRLEHRHLHVSGVKLIEDYRMRAERLIASARRNHPRLPPIHFDYVNSPFLNAYAFKRDCHYFIGFTLGAFVILRLLFMRMLADPNAMLSIGAPHQETKDLPHIDSLISDMGNTMKLPSTGQLVVGAPQDPARLQFAVSCFEIAFSFLIRHEITHILHGHLAHPIVAATESLLPELGWHPRTVSTSSTRQVFEYDADRYASIGLGKAFMSNASAPQNTDRNQRHNMTEIFVGVGSLFKLFGDGSVVGFDLGTLPYPPVRYRQYISMTGFCDYLKLVEDMTLYNLSRQVFPEFYEGRASSRWAE
jgi:hypothetical protein